MYYIQSCIQNELPKFAGFIKHNSDATIYSASYPARQNRASQGGARLNVLLYSFSLLLAALMGFAVHRAGLCMVKTVAEMLSTHRAFMMATVLKAVLWVIAISIPVLLLLPEIAAPNRSYAVSFAAAAGGFLFGVGAATNGGCAFSTLGRLANGNLWMLTTLLGFCFGVAGFSIIFPMTEPGVAIMPLLLKAPKPLIGLVLLVLWFYLGWEIVRLWRSRQKSSSWVQLFFARHYRLSTGAILLGISGGMLYAFYEAWTYTNALKRQVQSLWLPVEQSLTINLLLFLALFSGMLLSAWQRGSFKLRWHRSMAWPRHFIGGLFMGAGSVLIPGGNDTLILKSLPGLSPHAMPAAFALLCGVGVTLLIIRLFTGKPFKVDCTDDVCRTEN